jgi:hypothetical protein
MKIIPPLITAMLLAACVLTGCQSPMAMSSSGSSVAQSTRNNCYSLLHQLLDEQKDVSILRFIKPEQTDLKKLMKRIATTSGTGAKLLEEFAKDDPSIRLDAGRVGHTRCDCVQQEEGIIGSDRRYI